MTQTCVRCGLFHPQNAPCVSQALTLIERHDELAINAVLTGRYRILRTLHHGGMSVVYLAEDTLLGNRHVAIKELRVPAAAGAEERHEAEAWFAREAYILSILNHPLVPEFYSSFPEGGTSYIVQEYVDGENLNDVVRARGPFSEDLVVDWAISLCGLLSHLHGLDEPVLFRDLKPANIVLRDMSPTGPDRSCPLKVVDFGIARHYQPKTVGTVIGTPGYAPPEQYQGLATPQSDVYALGATLHRLLTGFDPEHGTPFCYPNIHALNPLVSRELAAVVEKAVRLDPSQRYASADEFTDALLDLAWERGQTGIPGVGIPGGQWHHARATRSQQAFRWTALVVCLMMVAPGVFSVLAGMSVSSTSTVPNIIGSPACQPAETDGAGGPYPAPFTSDCRGQLEVDIQVIPDASSSMGFAPSNVTVSPGTTVKMINDTTLPCTLGWQHVADVDGADIGLLTRRGDYPFACRQFPNVVGLVQVR
jgi:serine/threonine protein kinase